MTTIDDKLELFNKLIFDKIYSEKKVEIDKFNAEKEEIIKTENEKKAEKREAFVSEINRKALIKKSEIIAKEEMAVSQKYLSLKRELLTDLMLVLKDKVIEFTKSEDYSNYLLKMAEECAGQLENKNYVLYLTSQDLVKYGKKIEDIIKNKTKGSVQLRTSITDFLGGLIIEDEKGSYRLNNTLQSKLDEAKESAGLYLTDLLA